MSSLGFQFDRTLLGNLCLVLLLTHSSGGAAEIPLEVEKSTVITFPSEPGKTYRVLSAGDPSPANWALAQDGIQGTGGKVTIFYKSDGDQKLFFKVEEGPTRAPNQKPLFALAQLSIANRDLTGYQMAGEDLNGFTFNSVILDRANLKGADLTGASFIKTSAQGADLSNARVKGLHCDQVNFSGANLSGNDFSNATLYGANFSGANLTGDMFSSATLSGAIFTGANLTGTSFEFCNLAFAKLASQNLSNRSFRGAYFDGADLRGSDLSGTDLRAAVFYQGSQVFSDGIKLEGANCEGAFLAGLVVNGSDLRRTMVRGAEIGGASFADVNLSGNDLILLTATPNIGNLLLKPNLARANLRNAKLRGAFLRWADLKGADFTGADLSYADLAGADLTGAIGFDSTQPGIYFGSGIPAGGGYGGYYGGGNHNPDPYGIYGFATLPDGSQKSGANAGSNFAPETPPAKLHLSINEDGAKTELNLDYSGGHYYAAGVDKGSVGQWSTARGIIAVLALIPNQGYVTYTLLFDTPNSGQLFRRPNPSLTPNSLIGTFSINP